MTNDNVGGEGASLTPPSHPHHPATTVDPDGAGAEPPKSIYEIMMTPYDHSQQRPSSESSSSGSGGQGRRRQVTALARPNHYYDHGRANAHRIPQEDMPDERRKLSHLPFPLPWHPVAGPAEPPVDFGWITESCGGKAAIGIFGGGVMGLLMGVFLGAMSDMTPPVTVINGKEVPQAPLKEQMRTTMRATAEKSVYWCRQFAFITGVFGGSECLVEKYRGKHDIWNGVVSGCITGAAMQAKQGPQAAALGCGGFAAFSLVIEQFMGNY